MSDGINISVEGLEDLYLKLDVHVEKTNKASRAALRKGAMQIINDAKQNLRDGGNIASGNLRASGKVQKVEGNADAIDAGFFSKNTSGGYAYYVEYGRKAGGVPPISSIEAWLRKKTATAKNRKNAFDSASVFMRMNPGQYRQLIATRIAWSIAKNGTTAHPFFNPAVEKNKDAVTKAIEEAVKKEIK